MKNKRDKTIALAGVFQSATLVHQIALKGTVDVHDLETSIRSTLNLTPSSTLGVYGNLENLRTGLHSLVQQLSQNSQRDVHITRYVISLLHLQRKVVKRTTMLNTIAERIQRVQEQAEIFSLTHSNVLANLASIYSETISLISPKIMVSGDANYLANPSNADKIRSLLLAGIRSAVLWSQVGGSRWQILLYRKLLVQEAQHILDNEMGNILH